MVRAYSQLYHRQAKAVGAVPTITELLGQAYLSVNWEATVDDIAHFVQPHPSLSENFGEAVLALTGRSLNS